MEIGKSQIARLVLGYLKSENCMNAFNEFLTASKHLEQHAPFVKNGKYFSTRVGGLTLVDIIMEYSEISCLVEGKLEQTNYYEEHHKMNLVNQLIYIFDNYCQPQQPTMPILAKGLNTTPSESLPGNSPWKNTSKDSSSCPTSTFEEGLLADHGNISQISQTLLEKSELHEKLANAINSVCNSSQETDMLSKNTFAELDNKIKTIVQKAEQDPLFDEILDEIIGTTAVQTANESSPCNLNFNTSRSLNVMKNQAGSSKSNKSGEAADISLKTMNTSTPNKVDSEVIVFNGNLDSYVGNTGALVQPQSQSQIYLTPTGVNSAGLLMVPSMIAAPNYFILNNQPSATGIMSDSDIMKMPTIILNDAPPITATKEPEPHRPKCLAPKCDSITVSTQCGDYEAVYKDDGEVIVKNDRKRKEEEMNKKKKEEEIKMKKEEEMKKKKATAKPRQSLGIRKKLPRKVKIKPAVCAEIAKHETPSSKTNIVKTTPKSGSHVRTLNFTTPPKDNERNVGNDSIKNSASKVLFGDAKKGGIQTEKKTKKSSWDADLRELLIPQKTLIRSPDTSADPENLTQEDDAELESNAKLIEEAFRSPVKTNALNKTPGDEVNTQTDEQNEGIIDMEIEEKENSLEMDSKDSPEKKPTTAKITVEETELYLRNCNGPQRFKKKCNITNDLTHKYDVDVVIETEQEVTYVMDGTLKKFSESRNNEFSSGIKTDLVLETPTKSLPKTPGKCELTPFSKALEEHLQGMDLLAMPTPNLPITPSYPITPSIALNTPLHVNRPTDYSTSSSYYQPSDTEQNKSLELMIEECKKLEKRELYDVENPSENPVCNEVKTAVVNITDIKRVFNENAVGKKNLNLITSRNALSSDSERSNSSSDATTSSSSDSDSEYDPREETRTVIKKETYCLRNRTPIPRTDIRKLNRSSSLKTPSKPASKISIDKKNEQSNSKNRTTATQISSQMREKSTKVMKKNITKRRSCISNERNTVKTNEQISKILEAENEVTDDDITLHLSTDEESVNRPSTETTKNKDIATEKIVEKQSPSDFEAEQLVQGLRERGIHLMHKKSPKKSTNIIETESHTEENAAKIETSQVILKNEDLQNEKNEIEILSSKSTNSSISTKNDLEMSFDIKCFENEHLSIDFNYNKKKPKRKINHVKVLAKKLKATVYIETLDTELERVIECTPFETIFDFIPQNISKKSKKPSTNSDSPKKLLTMSSSGSEGKKNKTKPKEKMDSSTNKQLNASKKQCKEDIKDTNSNCEERIEPKPTKNLCNESKITADYSKNTKKTEVEKNKKSTKKVENESIKNKNEINAKSNTSETMLEDDVPGVSSDKTASNMNKAIEEKGINPSDDELMNYAAIGSLREENSESPRSGDKRKHSNSEDTDPVVGVKKYKSENRHALLKKIDVDVFLNKVHGNLGKPQDLNDS